MSIPSSPEVEAAVKCIDDRVCEWTVTDTHRPETVESVEQKDALLALRSAQHAASTQPLLAEIEMFRASCAQYVRRIAELNDENQGKQDRLNKLYLIESNLYERLDRTEAEARDRQSEVVRQVNAKLAAQEEAQKLREALTKYGSHLVFCPGFANNDAECTCGLRKALGGSK